MEILKKQKYLRSALKDIVTSFTLTNVRFWSLQFTLAALIADSSLLPNSVAGKYYCITLSVC